MNNPIGAIILIAMALFIYFLPSVLGWHKKQAGAILMLNFLLGWTVLGWIGAMIWASIKDKDA